MRHINNRFFKSNGVKKYFAILLLVLVLLPTVALAQNASSPNVCSIEGIKNQTGGAASTLPRCVNQIYVWSLGIAVLLALLMIIIGGYYLMTAAGNAEQATKGKEYITSALIGVAILFTAYLLLNQINPDLVNFNLDSFNNTLPQPK